MALPETQIDSLVRQLYSAGLRPSDRLVNQILAAGAAARPALLGLATRTELLHEDEPECWAPLHALRLLGEQPDPTIIPALMAPLPIPVYFDEDEYGEVIQDPAAAGPDQLWSSDVLQIVGRCGAAGLPALAAWADDPAHNQRSRGAALHAMAFVATFDPPTRDAIVADLRVRLAQSDDPQISASIVTALAELGAQEAYSEVMAAYRERRVDPQVIAAGSARQMLLGGGHYGLACVRHPFWERYEEHGPFTA